MAEVKPLALIKEKWARVTPERGTDYKIGVQNPRRSWQAAATAAKESHKAAMVAAAAADSYAKGVAAAGDTKWQTRTIAKGPSRFQEGVMVGASDYEKGFAPVREAFAALTPPPRFPKGDVRNLERVKAFAMAARSVKTAK